MKRLNNLNLNQIKHTHKCYCISNNLQKWPFCIMSCHPCLLWMHILLIILLDVKYEIKNAELLLKYFYILVGS